MLVSSVSANTSCGGGGASDIRLSPFQLNNRIVVASGGGGMGGGTTDANGGGGGCASGINGSSPFGVGGFGGTQNSGGNGGLHGYQVEMQVQMELYLTEVLEVLILAIT